MTKNILGIDVGMNGALAFYDGDELMIYDMPTTQRNKTKRVDCKKLLDIIGNNKPTSALIEQVNAFGMGRSSAYNFGWSCGVIEACLEAFNIPYEYITPQVWKKKINCPKDKNLAREHASSLMPIYKHNWDLKKHDGRAEASLIAYGKYNNIF